MISGPSVMAIVQATVCASPSPPPPPEPPHAIKVARYSLHLAWNNAPIFTGAPIISYELEQRGNTRNNITWTPVFPPWYPDIVSLSKSIKVSHRIPGIGLHYRVRARNCGGWGAFSKPTEMIMAKPWLEDWRGNVAARAMRTLER